MGIGFKTSWIAVRDRTPAEVADVLRLADREEASWAVGTERAYRDGLFVGAPVDGWTLAHSRIDFDDAVGGGPINVPKWLARLSEQLGEVQFFSTHRVSDYYAWGRAIDGSVKRAVVWGDGSVTICEGVPTEEEHQLGIGIASAAEANDDENYAAVPGEGTIMELAALWSVNPTAIDDADVATNGILGKPPESPETAKFKASLAQLRRN